LETPASWRTISGTMRSENGVMIRFAGLTCALVLAAMSSAGGPARADQPSETRPDAVLEDVQRMLDEGVDSEVVLAWLSGQPGPARRPSSDELIRLTASGATSELLQALINRADQPVAPAPSSSPESPRSAAVPAPPTDGQAVLTVRLRYRSQSDSGDEYKKHWALFAYLDGEPLTWAESGEETGRTTVHIRPGRHAIRLLRESHRPRKDVWRHESRVSPETIDFEVQSGDGWSLSIEWIVPKIAVRDRPPLSWELTRWDRPVDGASEVGERKIDRWPQLCDDMEANIPPDRDKTPRWIQRELEHCVSWSSLWEEVEAVPSRETVRHLLEQTEFRPSRQELLVGAASPATGSR
jgi:hypothetical protein